MLAPHGVVVRDCSSFGLSAVFRVSVPDAHGLERVDSALRAALRGSNGSAGSERAHRSAERRRGQRNAKTPTDSQRHTTGCGGRFSCAEREATSARARW